MFDVGFSELIVIALVALVVIGPERLPKVARTVGHLLGRFQRYVSDVKADINREMQLEELRNLQSEMERSARELETSVSSQIQTIEDDLNRTIAPPSNEPSVSEAVDSGDSPAIGHETSSLPSGGQGTADMFATAPVEHAPEHDERQLALDLPPAPEKSRT